MPTVSCPNCKQEFDVDADQLGKICMCPKCGVTFTATAPQETHAPTPNNEDDVDGDYGKETSENLDDAWDALHTNWRNVVPLGSILSWDNLKKPLIRFCLFLTLFPILFTDLDSDYILHAMIFYFTMVWLLIFGAYLNVKFRLWFRAFGYMIFTATVGITIDYFLQCLPFFSDLYEGLHSNDITKELLGFCLGVGPIEEFVKMLPLLIFGINFHKITNERNGLFLGAASGFGFAITEGAHYMLMGIKIAFVHLFVRSLALSFLHAAWCGVIGFVIGSCMRQKFKPAWPFIVVAWIFSSLLHGLYDFFTDNPLITIVLVAIPVTIFVCMLEKAKELIPSKTQTPLEKSIIE
jgi:RsiW-degrading membrane proteinase PrsW (M82 family)